MGILWEEERSMTKFIEIDRIEGGIITIRTDSIISFFVSEQKIPRLDDEYYCELRLKDFGHVIIEETYDSFAQRLAIGKSWVSSLAVVEPGAKTFYAPSPSELDEKVNAYLQSPWLEGRIKDVKFAYTVEPEDHRFAAMVIWE